MEAGRLLKQKEIFITAPMRRFMAQTAAEEEGATIVNTRLLEKLGSRKKERFIEPTEANEDATIVDTRLLEKLMARSNEELEGEWKKCCIYQIPWYVKELNPGAYTPKLVSFGPYHHGSPLLAEMETHKHRALAHVLKRTGKFLEDYVQVLRPLTKSLMDCYTNLDEKWTDSPDKFLELMVLDGLFWLEILRVYEKDYQSDYCENDPMFSSSASPFSLSELEDDLYMLENQLPNLLTRTLALASKDGTESNKTTESGEEREKSDGIQLIEEGPLHFLDQMRNTIVGSHRQSPKRLTNLFFSATHLHNVGVVFKKKELANPLLGNLDITFNKEKGILTMPVVHSRMATESRMLNMVAFEHLHLGKSHEISAYIEFLSFLLETPKDVRLLQDEGLIFLDSPNAEKIVESLQKLRYEMRYIPKTSYEELRVDLKEYRDKNVRKWNKRFREWNVNLKKTYFMNPWTFISFAAAVFLLVLTTLGTYYTALSYYKDS